MHAARDRLGVDGLLALLCLAFALASLAASSFIALAGASLFLAYLARGKVFGRFSRGASLIVGLGLCLIVIAGALVVIATPIPELVEKAVREIIFDKAGSESGLERGAWAANGLVAFRETFGLGAGVDVALTPRFGLFLGAQSTFVFPDVALDGTDPGAFPGQPGAQGDDHDFDILANVGGGFRFAFRAPVTAVEIQGLECPAELETGETGSLL